MPQQDVIGVEARERRLPPGAALGAAVLLLGSGFGAGVLWSAGGPARPAADAPLSRPSADPLTLADGGLVYVCDGSARAFLFARGLPPGAQEVHLPLRGDEVLLPVLTEGAEVLTGSARGHQTFVPEDGYLLVVQRMGVPRGEVVRARVGEQRLTLAVRACGGGPR